MVSISKKQFILGIFILVLGLGLFGCNKQSVVNENVDVNINTDSDEIDTSTWKTYRNEEYGFEFRYPEEWIIQEDNFRANVKFDESVGLQISNLWYLGFGTKIVRDNRNVPIHIFFEDCNRVGANCQYDINNPVFKKNDMYIYRDQSSGGRIWNIAKVLVDDGNMYIKHLFGLRYMYDFNEGIGYEDYIGLETRDYLDQLLFNTIKTISFIN